MVPAVRLTDLLAATGLFGGAPPPAPPAGRYRTPAVGPELLARIDALPARSASWVRDPLDRSGPASGEVRTLRLPGGTPARQTSQVTCGAAVLTVLRYAGDPASALRLATAPDPAAAFAADQEAVHRASTRGPRGLPGWPTRFGTPPWGAAREARYGPVAYTHRVVGAPGSGAARRVLDAALAAAAAGVPVPLYSGGDLGRGVPTAVPRHVVLLTAVTGTGGEAAARLYEPSSGTLHALSAALLRDGVVTAARTRALGGWPHLVWAILPRGRSGQGPPWQT
ncbi:hypothetical protein [Isoptericola aurantiacus]|uniref:hypothetical protein n=1 Tax=Isoptericola aurantiacus TaxID=3377839 RepID=UPI003839D8CB